jgi:CheY-like chemotaxis protein
MPEPNLILLKGFGEQESQTTDIPLNITSTLSKPVKLEELYQQVRVALQDRVAGSASAGQSLPKPPGTPIDEQPLIESAQPSTGPRILIAEDNLVNQRLAFWQTQRLGYAVDTVSNGHEAVAAAATGQYMLILMDCQMPELDGFEATAAIRRMELEQSGAIEHHIPIVAMTASALEGDRELCIMAGMDDYLTKPVGLQQLQSAIERWVPAGLIAAAEHGQAEQPTADLDSSPDPAIIDAQ